MNSVPSLVRFVVWLAGYYRLLIAGCVLWIILADWLSK
jgi:hypothetical protein